MTQKHNFWKYNSTLIAEIYVGTVKNQQQISAIV